MTVKTLDDADESKIRNKQLINLFSLHGSLSASKLIRDGKDGEIKNKIKSFAFCKS